MVEPEQSPPAELLARMVFPMFRVPELAIPPVPQQEPLPLIVLSFRVTVPEKLLMAPPPSDPAEFPLIVLFSNVEEPLELESPPPPSSAEVPLMVLPLTVSAAVAGKFTMPPADWEGWLAVTVRSVMTG